MVVNRGRGREPFTDTHEHGPNAKLLRRIILVKPSYYNLWQSGLKRFAV
jgi:hypothetical protein